MDERRAKRFEHLLMREVEEIIRKHVSDPDIGFFTITGAAMSSDLKHARISVSVMGSRQEKERSFGALVKAAGYIQHKLAGQLEIKHVPRISFVYDERKEFKVEELLSEIRKESDEHNGERQD